MRCIAQVLAVAGISAFAASCTAASLSGELTAGPIIQTTSCARGTVNVTWAVADSAAHGCGLALNVWAMTGHAGAPYGTWNITGCTGTQAVPLVHLGATPFKFTLADTAAGTDPYWNNSIAETGTLAFTDLHCARAPRVSVGAPGVLRIGWTQTTTDAGAAVQVATAADASAVVANASAVGYTYSQDDLCGDVAGDLAYYINPGYNMFADVPGLDSAAHYFYRVRTLASRDWEPWIPVITPPAAGAASVDVVVFGDIGVEMPFTTVTPFLNHSNYAPAGKSIAMIRQVAQDAVAAVAAGDAASSLVIMHDGDISYARGYAFVWDWFMASVSEAAAANVPYQVSIGNHEADCVDCIHEFAPSWSDYGNDSSGEVGVPYWTRFAMPDPPAQYRLPATERACYKPPAGPDRAPPRSLWYSYQAGPIHFTVLSSEHDFLEGSLQAEWLAADLASVDRAQTPWVVMVLHRPVYMTIVDFEHCEYCEEMRKAFESLAEKYHVDVVIQAHVHSYMRTFPVRGNARQPAGTAPVYVTVGNAGNTYVDHWYVVNTHYYPEPEWLAFRTLTFGVSHIKATRTTLTFTYSGDDDGGIHDSFTLRASEQAWRMGQRMLRG